MYFTTIKFGFFIFDIENSVNLISREILFIINFSCIIDIFINFSSGYYDKGFIELNKKKIALYYIKGTLISDILGNIN